MAERARGARGASGAGELGEGERAKEERAEGGRAEGGREHAEDALDEGVPDEGGLDEDERERAHPLLRRRIFAAVFGVSISVMLAVTFVVAAACFWVYEDDAQASLLSQARTVADMAQGQATDEDMAQVLASIPFIDVRCTLISATGEVLFDNWEDASQLGSHADREEVVSARANNQASVVRRSDTLGTDTLYAAVLLDDGAVLRLAEVRTSLPSFLGSVAWPIALALVVVVALSTIVSRLLTNRIVAPLQQIELSCPTKNEAYRELQPLLERIDAQYRELAAQNVALEHANNMRREFTGNVSHEMKTPLQVIGGYAELMEAGMVMQSDVPRFAGLIRTEATTMRSLIDDVLTLSRLDEQVDCAHDPVDLGEVCQRVAERLQPRALERQESIQLACRGTHIVAGSASLAEQMVYNLVDNAVRYNRDGGLVLVTLASDERTVELEVSDEGPGIPPELRERVFERFFRVDASRSRATGGTGLGLAIVKHAVETLGGTVRIDSSACGGARFVVEMPTYKPPTAQE